MKGPFDLQRAVHEWVEEGIVDREQARRILLRHEGQIRETPTTAAMDGWLAPVLYAGAGIVLGAAVIAFLLLGMDVSSPQPALLLSGLALFGGGVALATTVKTPRAPVFADTLFIASFVPMVTSVFDDGNVPYALTVIVVAAFLIVWRHRNDPLAFLAVVAVSVAGAALFFDIFDDSETLAWVVLQAAVLVAVVAVDRIVAKRDRGAPAIAGILVFAIALTVYLFQGVGLGEAWPVQSMLGLAMLIIMAAGVALSHKGLVVGSVAVLAGDAIWFGFTIGGAFTGTIVLVAVAGFLVWQAEWLRTHLAG